jgi:hypothetical protein
VFFVFTQIHLVIFIFQKHKVIITSATTTKITYISLKKEQFNKIDLIKSKRFLFIPVLELAGEYIWRGAFGEFFTAKILDPLRRMKIKNDRDINADDQFTRDVVNICRVKSWTRNRAKDMFLIIRLQ